MHVKAIQAVQEHDGYWCEARVLVDGPFACGCQEFDCIVVAPGLFLCPCGNLRWMMCLEVEA